ncbi:hypothetical protein GJAV_G00157490 [Gymnothorax javanicus]|nr:hypothetical protein GJAV_G00157490 [Gymnothorax javanicus]
MNTFSYHGDSIERCADFKSLRLENIISCETRLQHVPSVHFDRRCIKRTANLWTASYGVVECCFRGLSWNPRADTIGSIPHSNFQKRITRSCLH